MFDPIFCLTQPIPKRYQLQSTNTSLQHQEDVEEKTQTVHLEQEKHVIVDDAAAGYVDPTIHISPEEDKRLRRKINKQ